MLPTAFKTEFNLLQKGRYILSRVAQYSRV